ncbi:MAG: IS6 family transposase, partial [Nitrososphaerales archaeon]
MANEPKQSDERMTRGLLLFQKKGRSITENPDGSWTVPSQFNSEISYEVRLLGEHYACTCPDFEQREIEFCKHVHAVKFLIASQVYFEEKQKPKVFSEDSVQCVKCGSIRVVKYGFDSGKQVFKCKDCLKKFVPSLIPRSKFTPELISLTLDLYFSGTSLRKIARIVSDHTGQHLGATTVYDWIQRFVPQISSYVNSLEPELSDTWQADELFVKMQNGIDYRKNKSISFLWNVMDRKTRFLLASKLSPLRDRAAALQAFKEAQKNAHGDYPERIFTDSLASYNGIPYMNAKGWNPKHVSKCGVNKGYEATNNRIERMNGTLRERVKVQRGWKSFESQIAEGQRIHYNFIKPHEALEGMTPAQRAGIPIENKWLEL